MHEDVISVVGITSDEIRSPRDESHESPVAVDNGTEALRICLTAVCTHADPFCRSGHAVMHKDIEARRGIATTCVVVSRHEVRSHRVERHIPPVGAQAWALTEPVGLSPGAVDAHPGGSGRSQVMNKDVFAAAGIAGIDRPSYAGVRIAKYKIGGVGGKGHKPAFGTNHRIKPTLIVGLDTGATYAHTSG